MPFIAYVFYNLITDLSKSIC